MTKVVKKDNENKGAQIRGKHTIDEDLREELARRFKNRNCPGYWGINARAWLKMHIKAIREGKSYGYRSY